MTRLRTVSPNDPGWSRRRQGKGFIYLDERGDRLSDARVQRVKELVIPPAWREVWVCRHANGHLQAVGTDDAGRRQYLYHPDWRTQRDEAKFERVTRVARRLPRMREAVRRDMRRDDMPRERAAATAVRLLDLGFFRIGGDTSGEVESFGLTTLQRRHVRRHDDVMAFDFVGKSGVDQSIEIDELGVVDTIEEMRRRRGGPQALLAWKQGQSWVALSAADVNDYLDSLVGEEFTAKDFRTWHATVLAAAALAASDESGDTKASRKRAERAAMVEVSELLGNTPTIARTSYVDPRVVDLYEDGVTIAAAVRKRHRSPNTRQAALERAVLRLLSKAPDTEARARRRRAARKRP